MTPTDAEKVARKILALEDVAYDECMTLTDAEWPTVCVARDLLVAFAERHCKLERLRGKAETWEVAAKFELQNSPLKREYEYRAKVIRAELAALESEVAG